MKPIYTHTLFTILLISGLSNCLYAQHLDFNDAASESFFVSDNAGNDLDVNGNWTFEGWVNIDNRPSGTFPVIMNRRYGITMYIQARTAGTGDYSIVFGRRRFSDDALIASMSSNNVGAATLSFDTDVHIAATRDGSTARLYVNGIEVDSSTDSDFVLANSIQNIHFGARFFGSYQRHLDGEIDEIRISDAAKYTSDFTPTNPLSSSADTRLLLHLNEGSGTALTDASGHFSGITLNDGDQLPDWITGDLLPIVFAQPLQAVIKEKKVFLHWSTAAESNNRGFEIQRSHNGKDWSKIGWHDGKGNSERFVQYNFTDTAPTEGQCYYRLKQIDFDEQFELSNIVSIFIKKQDHLRINVYPNPVQSDLFIRKVETLEGKEIFLYNAQGIVVKSMVLKSNKIDVSQLKKGVYYLQFELDNKWITKRFVKQ